MPIIREEILKPKSDKEHSLPLMNFLALKIAENFHLFQHFQAETSCVKQGHHPGITNYVWFTMLLSLGYRRAQFYYRSMKAHINLRQELSTNILYKKQIFNSGLFNNGFYGQDIVMAFLPPEYCRLFGQKKVYQGGGGNGHPRTPLATPLSSTVWLLTVVCVVWCKTFAASFALFQYVPSLTYGWTLI